VVLTPDQLVARRAREAQEAIETPTPTPRRPVPVPAPRPSPTFGPPTGELKQALDLGITVDELRDRSQQNATLERALLDLPTVARTVAGYMYEPEMLTGPGGRPKFLPPEPSRGDVLYLDAALDRASKDTGLDRQEVFQNWYLSAQIARGYDPFRPEIRAPGRAGDIDDAFLRLAEELDVQYRPPEPGMFEKFISGPAAKLIEAYKTQTPETLQAIVGAGAAAAAVVPTFAPEVAGPGILRQLGLSLAGFVTLSKTTPEFANLALLGIQFTEPGSIPARIQQLLAKEARTSGDGSLILLGRLVESGRVTQAEANVFLRNITPTTEDIGVSVMVDLGPAGRSGVLTNLIYGPEQTMAEIVFPEGQKVLWPAAQVVKAPGGGAGTTMSNIASGQYVAFSKPLTATYGGFLNEPAGRIALHGTSDKAFRGIMEGGFRSDRLTFTTENPASAQTYASTSARIERGKPVVAYVEVPSNPKLLGTDEWDVIMRKNGQDEAAAIREAVQKGYDGFQVRPGDTAWFNPTKIRPVFGTPPGKFPTAGPLAEAVAAARQPEGGYTLTSDLQKYAGGGFVVSTVSKNVSLTKLSAQAIQSFRDQYADILSQYPNMTVGVFNMGGGKVSIDLNVVLSSREEAETVGRALGQKAIWDDTAGELIQLGGVGVSPIKGRAQLQDLLAGIKSWVKGGELGALRFEPTPEVLGRVADLRNAGVFGFGQGWYDGFVDEAKKVFGGDTDLFLRLLAATSPRKSFDQNVKLATKVLAAYKRGGEEEIGTVRGLMMTHMPNVKRAIAGEEIQGPKVTAFLQALRGDPNAVTIDSHMLRAFGFAETRRGSEELIGSLKAAVTALAKEAGVTPREYQAAVWVGYKLHIQARKQGTVADAVEVLRQVMPAVRDALTGPLGEEGASKTALTFALGRVVAGGMAGGMFPAEDVEERVRNVLIGAGLGALAGPEVLGPIIREIAPPLASLRRVAPTAEFARPATEPIEDLLKAAGEAVENRGRFYAITGMAGGAPTGHLSPALEAIANQITNTAQARDMMLFSLSRAAEPMNLPTSFLGRTGLFVRRIFNPGVSKFTRNAFFHSYNWQQVEFNDFNRKMLFLMKAVRETFGEAAFRDPAGQNFIGLFKMGTFAQPSPATGAEATIVGTLADIFDRPTFYNLSPLQQRVVSLWNRSTSADQTLMADMGFDAHLVMREYVPFKQAEDQVGWWDRWMTPQGGKALGGAPRSYFKKRSNPTLLDWTRFLQQHGQEPELDIFKLYARRLLGTARLRTEQVYLQGILENVEIGARAIPKGKSPLPGYQELAIGKLPSGISTIPGIRNGRWQVPDIVAREVQMALSPQNQGEIANIINQSVALMRGTMLSADASFLTVQGYALAVTDPVRFLSRIGESASVAISHEGYMLHLAQNYESYSRFAQSGGTLYMSATDVPLAPARGLLSETFTYRKLPGIRQVDEFGFNRLLPQVKKQMWESTVQMLDNISNDRTALQWFGKHLPPGFNKALRRLAGVEGRTVAQLEEAAADVVNNIGGGINWAATMQEPGVWGNLIMLTPGWLRANMGRIINSAKIGDPKGVLARRWMMQNLAITASISTGLSILFGGRLPNYDPRATDFLDIQLPGGSVPILPGKTYIRTIFRAIGGVPWDSRQGDIEQRVSALWNFGKGREGMFPRLALDLATGRDAFGRVIDDKLLYAVRSFLPLVAQSLMEQALVEGGIPPDLKGGPLGAIVPSQFMNPIAQSIGLNYIPHNPFDVRDKTVAAQGYADPVTEEPIVKYAELTEVLRAKFDREFPEYTKAVAEYQEVRDSPFSQLRGLRDQQRFTVQALGKALRGDPMTEQEVQALTATGQAVQNIRGRYDLYPDLLAGLNTDYRGKVQAIVERNPLQPMTTSQRIVSNYYKQVVESSLVAGKIDPDLFDYYERQYRAKVEKLYGPKGLAVLDEETVYRTTDDDVAQAYHKDQKMWGPYYDNLDSFWTPANIRSVGLPVEASKYPSFNAYKAAIKVLYIEELAGKPLPSNIGQYRSSAGADTIYERFAILPGAPVSRGQAQMVADELVRLTTKEYSDRLKVASDSFLKTHTDILCGLQFWGRYTPTVETRPYTSLCTLRVP